MPGVKVLFEERQRFTQWWIWVLLLAINGLMFFGLFYQVVGGRPWGDRPASDAELIIIAALVLGVTLFIRLFRLDTRITTEGVHVRFSPVHRRFRFFAWSHIRKAYVRQYAPLREYGGWGIRFSLGKSGKAYNIRGNRGLQLEMNNGKKLLIGTSRPEELEAALVQAGQRPRDKG